MVEGEWSLFLFNEMLLDLDETKKEKEGEDNTEDQRTLRIFSGAFNDFKKRYPHYLWVNFNLDIV